MKAVAFQEHGKTDVLTYGDYPTPTPGPGEVLVKLEAAALNRLDLWVREGWPGIKISYPFITGSDGAGTIAALGSDVSGWETGNRVVVNANIGDGTCENCLAGHDNRCLNWNMLGETVPGTYAEYVTVPARNLVRIPDDFEMQKAAASGLVFQTAWHSLITIGKLQAGETVLVVGASGGVNTASIQIAKLAGAEVYVVGSNPAKLRVAQFMGADHFIDRSTTENWSKEVYKMTNKRGVDVVVDNVGTTYYHSFRAARIGGRILSVGNTGAPKFEIDNRYIFGKHLSIIGSTMGTLKDFSTAMQLVFEGKLSPVIDQVFPLSEARAAQERLEKGEQLGKIILDVGE
jgi:NADPH:quinone reductase-like Zn-dependent oxidoreductase